MDDLTQDSERILRDSRAVLHDNREGGRHRRARSASIGRGSARMRARHVGRKARNIAAVLAAIFFGFVAIGLAADGIGFTGLMIGALLAAAAVIILGRYPKMKVPTRADLNTGDVRQLVGRTELWLEAQRPALPPPAVQVVDGIGVQLDALGLQLEGLDQSHPSAVEVRKLVGETLPGMVDSYRRIPAHLRTEKNAGGKAPDEQLTESLGKISGEIDSITRQLAQGSLDDLAIKHRYLDYKYGDAEEVAAEKTR